MSESDFVTVSFLFIFFGTVILKLYEDRPREKPLSFVRRRRSSPRWDF